MEKLSDLGINFIDDINDPFSEEILSLKDKAKHLYDEGNYEGAYHIIKGISEYFFEKNLTLMGSVYALQCAFIASEAGFKDEAIKYASKCIDVNLVPYLTQQAIILLKEIN